MSRTELLDFHDITSIYEFNSQLHANGWREDDGMIVAGRGIIKLSATAYTDYEMFGDIPDLLAEIPEDKRWSKVIAAEVDMIKFKLMPGDETGYIGPSLIAYRRGRNPETGAPEGLEYGVYPRIGQIVQVEYLPEAQ